MHVKIQGGGDGKYANRESCAALVNYLQHEDKERLEKGKIKENPKNKYYLYSIPLFDQKHEKALIIKDYSCGSLCGKTTIEIYIKTENSWKFYKSVFLLES